MRLTLFPFYVTFWEAMRWLKAKSPNSITSWDDLVWKFFIQFFPSEKTARLRSEILSFREKDGETLYQAWERFKYMLRDFWHHYQTNEVLVHKFIEGLEQHIIIFLDSIVSEHAREDLWWVAHILNCISQKNCEWNVDVSRNTLKNIVGLLEICQ